ncbi:hypothetical protein [Prescottella equi]
MTRSLRGRQTRRSATVVGGQRRQSGAVGAQDVGEDCEQFAQPGGAVFDGAAVDLAAAGIDDRNGVIVAGSGDAAGQGVGWF